MAIENISRHEINVSATPTLIPWKDEEAQAITYVFEPGRTEDLWLVHAEDDNTKTRGLMIPSTAGGDECVQRGEYEANTAPMYLVGSGVDTIFVTVVRNR